MNKKQKAKLQSLINDDFESLLKRDFDLTNDIYFDFEDLFFNDRDREQEKITKLILKDFQKRAKKKSENVKRKRPTTKKRKLKSRIYVDLYKSNQGTARTIKKEMMLNKAIMIDYSFISEKKFKEMLENNFLLETIDFIKTHQKPKQRWSFALGYHFSFRDKHDRIERTGYRSHRLIPSDLKKIFRENDIQLDQINERFRVYLMNTLASDLYFEGLTVEIKKQ